MDPLTLAALFSGGSMLGGLLGGAGKQDAFQQYLRQLMRFTNPGQIGQDTNALFKQFTNSPAFSFAQNANIMGANTLQNQLGSRLGQSGLGQSGIGQAAQSMANSSLGPSMGRLYAGGYQGASQMAQELARMRVSGLQGGPMPLNVPGQFFGAGMGGLGDVLKMLMMRGAKPGMGGGGGGAPDINGILNMLMMVPGVQ